jgi:hypothetical protein
MSQIPEGGGATDGVKLRIIALYGPSRGKGLIQVEVKKYTSKNNS